MKASTILPDISDADIVWWVGETSMKRGRPYFRDGAIVDPRRQGMALRARCFGSLPDPYRVEVVLGSERIVRGDCSCPVGEGGRCKHAAALLLAWLDDPESFVEVEALEAVLKRRGKVELIDLVVAMIARHPDLEDVVDLPVPSSKGKGRPLDPKVIARQAKNAIDSSDGEWGAARSVARDLTRLVGIGDGFVRSDNFRDAAIVYQAVAKETLGGYETLQDENGDLHEVVGACVTGLGKCLAEAEGRGGREALLLALFDIYRWDVEFGGIGMGDEAYDLMLEQASPAEKTTLAGWVRDALPTAKGSWGDDYHRQVFGGFLLDLKGEALDDESFLRLCRETGRRLDLVTRLIDLGREDEATAEARDAGDYDLLLLADLFVAHGLEDRAEGLIHARSKTSRDHRLKEWLKACSSRKGDLQQALRLAEELFRESPSLHSYREVAEIADKIPGSQAATKRSLDLLRKLGQYVLITEIHLGDQEIERAIETLKKVKTSAWGWNGQPLAIKVARAAETSKPKVSIDLYLKEVDRLIGLQGRPNYAEAATYLGRVRELLLLLGDEAGWEARIADLRSRHTRLRALREELDKVGL